MPNWCFTQMIFHGEKKEIEDFHNKIEEWTSKNYEANGFGTGWLGNVLHGAGLGDRVDSETNRLRCRGDITFIGEIDTYDDGGETTFNLDTETAWGPMTVMWSEVINIMGYKTIGFSYCAEEPGCEIYEIYDPYGDFEDEYYVDSFVDGDDTDNEKLMKFSTWRDYRNDDDLRTALQEFLETDEDDLETLIKQAEGYVCKSAYTYVYIHKYRHVDEPTG